MAELLSWIVLFAPLISVLVITLVTVNNSKLSVQLSIGAVIGSFLGSLLLAVFAKPFELQIPWIQIPGLVIDLGFRFDELSKWMLLVVTGVGSVIHVYSAGYMKEDRSIARFFACLSLFMFSMLGIVVSNNLMQLFVFWELVGVSSYLLIGFWYEKPSAADAAKKAFITNRIGDFGFLLGILLVWGATGTVNLREIYLVVSANPNVFGTSATLVGLLLFCGAMGKSAQFPLHVWLPDAMEGPTPVSALIHAATMVAAGIFMLCRVFLLLDLPGSVALEVIAWIGALTALLAALMAVRQDDIKRILAYSTLSQLGYMTMSVGLGGPSAAMYHLITHAFFKALLFLGAGAVIYAMHHEQNIWRMGGLARQLPVTYRTFMIGTFGLCGVPFFSGFYSKDAILAQAFDRSVPLFILGVLISALTTFYMFRLILAAFYGQNRSSEAEHAHEAPSIMTIPLCVLAVPSVFAGVVGIGEKLNGYFYPNLTAEMGLHGGFLSALFEPFSHSPGPAFLGLFAFMFGVSAAVTAYKGKAQDDLGSRLGIFGRVLRSRFYFDEIYEALVRLTQDTLAKGLDWVDRWLVAGLAVKGTHGAVELVGRGLRLLQTGNLQTYAVLLALGVAWVLVYKLVLTSN